MTASKSAARTRRSAKSAHATRARATAEPAALARLSKPFEEVLTDVRETSRQYALAGLGLASQLRKQREEKMASMIAEGKRVEPKIRQAVANWKETLQSKVETSKLKLRIDTSELRRRFAGRSSAAQR
jgi:hypothetical protein